MTRSLVMCADDFGLSPAINAAVVELAQSGRVTAVSCMTTMSCWQHGAPALGELRSSISAGLHFNLTEGPGAWPLRRLMAASFSGRLALAEVGERLDRQLDAFEAGFAAAPEFVDGHQHVHMLPGVRQTFVSVIARRYGPQPPWIRWVQPPLRGHDDPVKALVLRTISTGFRGALARAGLRRNLHFGGLYSLRSDAPFAALLESWLQRAPDGTLLMCHPGLADPADPLSATRALEYHHLRSERLQDALQQSGTVLTPHPALG